MDINTNNVHDGHRQRMRNRFIETGFKGFEPHQIIEMLLFYACPRKDTNELAHMLIKKFGSLAGIFDASVQDLMSVNGISENAAVLFKMIPKCVPLYFESKTEDEVYDNTDKLKELFRPWFVGVSREEFRIACFDNNLKLINNRLASDGGPSASAVDMRKLVEIVMLDNTSLIAIAHNHPSGFPIPSKDDIMVTRIINTTMKTIGVTLLDHIIVGANQVVSMKESALINIFD